MNELANELDHVAICSCGYISVFITGDKNSYCMSQEDFEERYGFTVKLHENKVDVNTEDLDKDHEFTIQDFPYANCNACVNHWATDMCACGSGEPYDECKEGFDVCGQPMQKIGKYTNVRSGDAWG